jgi:hypothetical protein
MAPAVPAHRAARAVRQVPAVARAPPIVLSRAGFVLRPPASRTAAALRTCVSQTVDHRVPAEAEAHRCSKTPARVEVSCAVRSRACRRRVLDLVAA